MKKQTQNAREAAYLALLGALRDESYISHALESWRQNDSPTSQDYQLAQEIAYGSCRMALALDYYAQHLSHTKKLNLKLKEKVLLRTAIYQKAFLDRIPTYAIVDETVKIAKRHCHQTFVSYLNALLRKLDTDLPPLPQGNSLSNLGIRCSYPEFFVKELTQDYGIETAAELLKAGNQPAPAIVRIRQNIEENNLQKGLKKLTSSPCLTAIIEDRDLLKKITQSKDYYVQNVTPATLIGKLAQKTTSPSKILDLCASPGGKILTAHDFFPKAELFANDISEQKLKTLQSNFEKYEIPVTLSCSEGDHFISDTLFDLIILDVPCSNSGVLNKRPEARWRLSQENLEKLEALQLNLFKKAASLLSPNGSIWYMTCSILKRENENLVSKACQLFDLSIVEGSTESILPNQDGWDGGFACMLQYTPGSI